MAAKNSSKIASNYAAVTAATRALGDTVDEIEINALTTRRVNDLIRQDNDFAIEAGPYIIDLLVSRAGQLAADAQERVGPVIDFAANSYAAEVSNG